MPAKTINIVAIANIIGDSGNIVNERQVLHEFLKHSNKLIIISQVSPLHIIKGLHRKYAYKFPEATIIYIPFIQFPFKYAETINIILYIIYSHIILYILYIIYSIYKINLIYVRDPRIAAAIVSSRKFANITYVKIAAFLEDEITGYPKTLFISMVNGIDKYVISKSAGIIVHSEIFAYKLEVKRNIKPRKIFIIPPGIQIKLIKNIKKRCPRKDRGDRLILGFLGSLEPWQGADMLCDISNILEKLNYPNEILIIGDGRLKWSILEKCKNKVTITGFLPHQEALCMARKMFDVLLLPRIESDTTNATIPIKIVEAIALGIPVVATRLRALEELEGDGVYLVDRDPHKFVETIIHAIKHGYTSGEAVASRFAYEINVSRFLEEVIDLAA